MLSYKDSLKVLKKTRALLEGHFILSSGLHSNKYIQCAKLLSFPNHAFKICNSLSKKILKAFPFVDLILSPAMGGIVIGYEIGRQLNIETIFSERIKRAVLPPFFLSSHLCCLHPLPLENVGFDLFSLIQAKRVLCH